MLLVLFVVLCAGGAIWAHNDEFSVGRFVGGIILIDFHGGKDAYIAKQN